MDKIFLRAVEIALAFDKDGFPGRNLHLSFLVYKGRFVSIAGHKLSTHPVNVRFNRKVKNGIDYSHFSGTCSEFHAFLKLKNTTNIPFEKCILINVRINKLNELNLACPCGSCKNLIKYLNLKRVYYSDLSKPESPVFREYLTQE